MRSRHLPTLLALLSLTACESSIVGSGVGEPSLAIVVHEPSDGRVASQVADQVLVHLSGPTDTMVTAQPGTSRTITGLRAGSYTIRLEGWLGSTLLVWTATTSATVTAGESATVAEATKVLFEIETVTTSSSLPLTGGATLQLSWTAVPSAASYLVEWSDDSLFAAPRDTATSQTSITLALGPPGTYSVRVSPVDASDNRGPPTALATPAEVANQRPTVSITEPSVDPEVIEGASLTFSGSGTDPETGALPDSALTWRSDMDGEIGNGASFQTTQLSAATHAISLIGIDPHGGADTATVQVSVYERNAPPVATITAPSQDTTALEGAVLTFTGEGQDAFDGLLTGAALAWESDLDGPLGTGGTLVVGTLSVGAHVVSLIATDSEGAADTASVGVTIAEDLAPTVTITAPGQDTTVAFATDSVTFTASAADVEDGDLSGSISWTSSLDGPLGTGPSLTVLLSGGVHTVTAAVTDAASHTTADTVLVTMPGNQRPVVTITAPGQDTTVAQGASVTLEATAVDAEDGDLTGSISWVSDLDGNLGTGGSLSIALGVGVHAIEASVVDAQIAMGVDTVFVTVSANQSPTVTITAPGQDTTVVAGATVTFEAVASDPEDGDLTATITWTSDLDGSLGSGGTNPAVLSVGVHTVQASVSDGQLASASDVVTVTVLADQPPSVTISAPGQDTTLAQAIDSVTLTASAVDPEEGDLSASIAWVSDIDGALGTGASLRVLLTGGVHTVTASVSDGAANSATDTVLVTMPGNQRPTVTITTPSQDTLRAPGPDSVTFVGTASDPEDGDLSASIEWRVNESVLWGTGPTVDIGGFTSAGVYLVTANVTDSQSRSHVDSLFVTVSTPPTATITAPGQDTTVVEGDNVLFSGTGDDVEDGPLIGNSLAWFSDLDGFLGNGGVGTNGLSVGTHNISFVVTDSHGFADTATVQVTVDPRVLLATEFCGDYSSASIVTFTDAAIAAAVRGSLALGPTDDVTCAAASTVIVLSVLNSGVTSLDGVQNLTGLSTLHASANQISDLGPVSGLTGLQAVYVNDNQITDLSPLAGLTNLIDLTVYSNQISSVVPLSGLTALTQLNISINQVSGIGALSGLSSLTTLRINNNQITNLAPLSGLSSLTYLNASSNGTLSDISPLGGLTSMASLFLAHNQITDVGAVQTLTGLSLLDLQGNATLSDIQPVIDNAGMAAGDTLYLQGTDASCSGVATLQARGVTVTADCSPPTVTITSPSADTTVSEGDVVSFAGSASDPEDGALTGASLVWTSDLDGPLGTGVALGVSLSAGSHAVSLIATDASALSDTATVQITVTPHTLLTTEFCSDYSSESIATFAHAALEGAVRGALGLAPLDDLTCGLVSSLTSLNAVDLGITDLAGAQNLTGATQILLRVNSITDVGPLSTLPSVTWLDLDNNNISDPGPLASVSSLETLILNRNQLTSLSSLSSMTSLDRLVVGVNQITDISPLTSMSGLTRVALSFNPITDFSPLAGMTALTELSLGSMSISDIGFLTNLTALTFLDLTGNNLSDVSVLGGLTALTQVHLGQNQISNIGSLATLTGLTSVSLDGNQVTDLSALTGLTSLSFVNLTDNATLHDLQPLLDNTGIGSGDQLHLSGTVANCLQVPVLESRGVAVTADCTAPVASITAPSVDTTVNQGDIVSFGGSASDAEEGALSGSSLVWESSLDGALGAGSPFQTSLLSAGTHTISLIATDASALSDTATVQVAVDPFYLAANGVTVVCTDAAIGDTATIGGVLYTKRSRAQIDVLVGNAQYPPLVSTCTSGITDMSGLFDGAATFNEAIGSWDVSNVTNMGTMFRGATAFNQPIGDWDVSNVTDMNNLFSDASSFNQDISGWDVSSVTSMWSMFYLAVAFDQPIGAWDVSSVMNMENMFSIASAFDQDISGWNVGSVVTMRSMFSDALAFNQPIGGWNVGSVTTMHSMFSGASAFNQDLGGWDVSSVTNMQSMFSFTPTFNQDLSGWDVSSVTNMSSMFNNAQVFNRDLSGWCVTLIGTPPSGFDSAATSWTAARPVWGTCSPASVMTSTVTPSPASLPADGTSQSTLVVQLRDASGADLTASAGVLTFDTPSSGSIGSVTDNANGSYTATYTAGATDGPVTITARLDGGLKVLPTTDITLTPLFSLAGNGITVVCTDAQVGDTATIGGVLYTKRSRAQLDSLVALPEYASLASTCTSGITDMSSVLRNATTFNSDIGSWDVSNVTTTYRMFRDAPAFDQDISAWDVSSVAATAEMFQGATAFNQPIGGWNVSSVTNMTFMFWEATSFNQPIGSWNVSNVTNMRNMFGAAQSFNQDISAWNVGAVTDMDGMFSSAQAFNQNIGGWNVSSVTTMNGMLSNAQAFNQDISGWNVSNVTNMGAMFAVAGLFNQDISGWDVSSVTNMDSMFANAAAFNQNLSGWCVSLIPSPPSAFDTGASAWVLARPVWGTCPG